MAARLRTALLPPAAVLAAHGAHTFTSDVPGLAPVEHGTPALVAEHLPGSEFDIVAAPPGTGPGTASGTGANLCFLCRAMLAGGLAALLALLLPRSPTLLGRPSARLRSRLPARPAQPCPPEPARPLPVADVSRSHGGRRHGRHGPRRGRHDVRAGDARPDDRHRRTEFDRLFLTGMIEHHRGAVRMAERQIADRWHPGAIALAESIRAGRSAEIAEMEQLLTESGDRVCGRRAPHAEEIPVLRSDRAPSRPPACSAARRLGAAVGLAVLTGCSAVGSPPAPAPSGAPGMLPAGHVHGVGIDPGDGALLLATHHGLLEVDDEGSLSAVGPEIDLMGFAVAGPDHYLASGHPGLTVDLPQPVGLIETTDGGRTWAPVSRQGQSDFHALTLLPDGGVLGYDGLLRRAADGTSWEQLAIPTEPYTLAASPDGTQVLATTPAGPLRSTDAGGSWAPVPNAPLLQVAAWSDVGGTAVGIGPRGEVWISTDFADTWERKGHLGAAPHAVAATTAGGGLRILAVTEQGVWESTDGGRTFTTVLTP